MRTMIIAGVAAIGFLVIGLAAVNHATTVGTADIAPTCKAQLAGGEGKPQRILVSGETHPGLAHSILVDGQVTPADADPAVPPEPSPSC